MKITATHTGTHTHTYTLIYRREGIVTTTEGILLYLINSLIRTKIQSMLAESTLVAVTYKY